MQLMRRGDHVSFDLNVCCYKADYPVMEILCCLFQLLSGSPRGYELGSSRIFSFQRSSYVFETLTAVAFVRNCFNLTREYHQCFKTVKLNFRNSFGYLVKDFHYCCLEMN